MSDIERYVDHLFGQASGYACLGFLRAGTMTHTYFEWPEERARLVSDVGREIATGEAVDIYVCPHLRASKHRAKGDAASLRFLHVDLDGPPRSEALWNALEPFVVDSGTGDHRHGYIALDRDVDLQEWSVLQRAVVSAVGADTKISDNDLLRLPGTSNHKHDPPTAVTIASDGGRACSPEDLGALLGPATQAAPAQAVATGPAPEPEPLPGSWPAEVSAAFANQHTPTKHDGGLDRSEAIARLVGACRRSGLSEGQAVSAVRQYPPAAEKFGTNANRLAADVRRVWDKEADTDIGRAELASNKNNSGSEGDGGGARGRLLECLPEHWWDADPQLQRIRRAAHNRGRSADAVLGGVLARHASRLPHTLRAHTRTDDTSLNLFVAIVGGPGTGKTSSYRLARKLLPADDVHQVAGLASGEALAELYMGWDKDGDGKKEHRQVRHNAFAFLDEGEVFMRQAKRETNTATSVLRTAFTGGGLGGQNATGDRTRIVPDDSYQFGAVFGFQPEKIDAVLDDHAGGTPQRFLYLSATDPNIPDADALDDGEIDEAVQPLGLYGTVRDARKVSLPRWVCQQLATDVVRQSQGRAELAEGEQHLPLLRIKAAALLATLCGRTIVSDEIWQAGCDLVSLSQGNYERLLADRDRRRDNARLRANRHEAERAVQVDRSVQEGRQERDLARAVQTLANKVSKHDGPVSRSELRRGLASQHRHLFDDALDALVADGGIEHECLRSFWAA